MTTQTPGPATAGDGGPAAQGTVTVPTTTGSVERAREPAHGAVEARLAACAQISAPVTSVYRWQGEVTTAQEWQVPFKTTQARYAALEAHLPAAHDYDTPEIIAIPVIRGSAGYLAWVAAETSSTHGDTRAGAGTDG